MAHDGALILREGRGISLGSCDPKISGVFPLVFKLPQLASHSLLLDLLQRGIGHLNNLRAAHDLPIGNRSS